ncbi:hypothetical protein R1sor_003134 [Riccia sorocarpa]|uniref:Uncharacterized protein n=1 Tax=Riccia sorocarpa TaxID=122646 RepID=A0ABD3H0Q2_9MARC
MAFASPLASLFAYVAAVLVVNPILEDDELVLSEEELEVVGNGSHETQGRALSRTGSEKHICTTAIKAHPSCFRAQTEHANYMKAERWWNQREDILARITKEERRYTVSNRQHNQRRVMHFKATIGRGRKRMAWTQFLYPLVRDEFERLRNACVKFSPGVLRSMAKAVLCGANHPQFTPQTVMPDCPKPLIERINSRWIQSFQEHFNIVHRAQTSKLMVSQAKQERIERSVAVHLRMLAGQFQSGQLDENLLENTDETHFMINMDNGKTLGSRGDNDVKYDDVVSGGQGMTMVVKVTGGVHARIGTPFMIFANQDCNYPIGNVPDNVPGVAYRTTKKTFITSA